MLSFKALQRGINVKMQQVYLCTVPLTIIPGAKCVRQKKPQGNWGYIWLVSDIN